MRKVLVILLFLPSAFGQVTQERVFHYQSADTEGEMQEIATVIRATADIRDFSADTAQSTLTLRGTAAQIALADWLFPELDTHQLDTHQLDTHPESSQKEYRFSVAGDDVVHVFYVTQAKTVQEFQELATAIRSTAELRYLFTYNATKAVVVRGTPDQIKLAGWLYQQMDKPAFNSGERQDSVATQATGPRGVSAVKVLYLTNTVEAGAFQELASLIRSTSLIRQAFTYRTPRALVVRGTVEETALAEWLANELDKPVSETHKDQEYKLSAKANDLVRVFYLSPGATIADFQQRVEAVRKATGVHTAYTYGGPRALVLRGTPNEITWADQLIQAQAK